MRKEVIGLATLYLGDCLEALDAIGQVGAVVSDPPYPNKAGHFLAGIEAARKVLRAPPADHVIAFWDEMDVPECPLPMVAKHAWFRTNTNRPDNYEAIYEWRADGKRRASRIFPFAVVAVGLTGCIEATGHPTQKHTELMIRLVSLTSGSVLDPFMGSGSTGVAAVRSQREFFGCEIDPKHFEDACRRIEDAQRQQRMFA
jgi:site-specific DNA-methyltransferase (adenine-specific)